MSAANGAALADAATAWLRTLEPARREQATFAFDNRERFVWHYVPGPRAGLSLGEMTPGQRDAAFGIVDAALSQRTASEVRAIVELEPILGEIEHQAGRAGAELRRDPARYWFAIFGEPGSEAPWSWRIGGHHVALTSTVAGGQVIASTPSFLGANPATVPSGPFAGRRAIDGEETLARALLRTLSDAQRRTAVVDAVAPDDILSGTGRRAELGDVPSGIRHDQLDAAQQAGLERLVRHYVERAAPEPAGAEWRRVQAAGLGELTFAWAGPGEPGQGHYYAIRGPSLLIEYDNTQNGANHIHSVWRDPLNDWGDDLLAAHYREAHAG